MRRTAYAAAFIVLAAAAALLTLRAQHTESVLVASRDLSAGTVVQAQDVEVVRMHADSVPAGALSVADAAIGRYVAWPLAAGEPVLARMLQTRRSGGAVLAGLDVPSGYRAVAVPVQPAAAVGGMLARGDRVDVYATPLPGHSSGVTAADLPTTASAPAGDGAARSTAAPDAVLLGHDVLVLQLRSDQGLALEEGTAGTVHGLNFGVGKLGSVVLAVPAADADRYAVAVADDSIYLALSVD